MRNFASSLKQAKVARFEVSKLLNSHGFNMVHGVSLMMIQVKHLPNYLC